MRAVQSVLAVFLLIWAGVAALAAVPPVLDGPTFLPGDLGTGASAGNQEEAAVAAGGSGFLVAWNDMRTSNSMYDGFGDGQTGRDIYAARLDAAGNLLDAHPIIVSQVFGAEEHPSVGWNGQNWLVAWRDQTLMPGGWYEYLLFGARIAPDGTLLDSTPILLIPVEVNMWTIDVTGDGSGQWLVTAQGGEPSAYLGVRVANDGTVLDSPPVALVDSPTSLLAIAAAHHAQDEYLVVYTSYSQGSFARRFQASDLRAIGSAFALPPSEARVASNGTDYFVVFDPSGPTLYGSRMTLDGTLLDPAGIPLMESLWDPSTQTDVTWDGTNWWVFHSLPYPDGGLHYVRVEPDGNLLDPSPVHVFDAATEEFVGTWKVTGGLSGGTQVVWADQDCNCADEWGTPFPPWDIRGRNVAAGGQLGPVGEYSASAPAQSDPDLAAGDGQFLSVFVSVLDEERRILAQRLDPLGQAIDIEPIEIASGSYVTNPAVSWNGSVYMIVWDDFFYCVGGDPGPCGDFIFAVRMLPDGTIVDPQPIEIFAGSHADVAALDDNFLVVGRNFVLNIGHWVIPLAMRVDGATGALLDPEPLWLGWVFTVRPRVTTFMGQWLVVWEQRASHDESWGGSRFNFVSADGAVKFEPLDAEAACGGATPDVAASGAAALVVCREGSPGHFLNDINGGIILPDETLGPAFEISGAVEEQRGPAVTWTGTEFLVAWEDKRNIEIYFDKRTDIYGTTVAEDGTVLDTQGFEILTGPLPEQQPTLVTGGEDALLAASVFRDDSSLTNYRIGTFHTPATPTDPAEVSFSGSPTTGCSPLGVSFTDQSVDPVTSWSWSFGDGGSSSAQNPSHLYEDPGTYTVFMTADAGQGAGASVRFDYITVVQSTQAAFSSNLTSACGPVTVNFTDASLGEPTSWLWTFGDDSFSTEQNPSHTYVYPGSYTVTLTAYGGCGSHTLTKIGYIDVPELCPVEHVALDEMSVKSNPVGDYTDTHPDSNSAQTLFEVNTGTTEDPVWELEHRWRFDVGTSPEALELHIHSYKAYPADDHIFEYSTDNVSFTPITTVSATGWYHTYAPVPSTLEGSVWVRVLDTSPAGNGKITIGTLAFERAIAAPDHPVEAIIGLTVDQSSISWVPAASATAYDVMRGDLGSLRTNGSIGDAWCIGDDAAETTVVETTVPPPGMGYYYVVRGDAEQRAAGTLDNPPGLAVPDEDRDEEVGTTGGSACNDTP